MWKTVGEIPGALSHSEFTTPTNMAEAAAESFWV
jgi:hypothetical protein